MDYCIKNHKNIYIRLNDFGAPVTCVEGVKGLFEHSKAKNILDCLPKTLKRMNFHVEAIPEIKPKTECNCKQVLEGKIIQGTGYVPSENITRWVEKFGVCSDILEESKQRAKYLLEELGKSDKELTDLLHIIELENPKDMFRGWKIYVDIRENRKKRRDIKDELLVIENILKEIDPSCLQRERVQKAIDGLYDRKYKFRIIEEDEDANM